MAQSFDEVDDLTRFADESFDTEEIDLFEFTGNDDFPLTRLKSIILSLDWEITDDILEELADEVASLSSMWETDKVAQVYLQGIDKVGKYLRAEGAYAHPNAIKLLLTQYYDFEKIVSSPDISGDEITVLLKSDIRKFKVLQYQIGVKKGVSKLQAAPETANEKSFKEDCEPLACLEATILGLEWEVTSEGLEKFNRQVDELREHYLDNKHAQILIQGLQAIGAYISDEKSNAHPDAYTLMHSFYEGLKKLINDQKIDPAQKQEIVVDHVNQLNMLKEIIAQEKISDKPTVSDETMDDILDFQDDDEGKTDSEPEDDNQVVDKVEDNDDDAQFDFGLDESDFEKTEQETALSALDENGVVAAHSGIDDFEIFNDNTTNNAAMETADEQYPDDILDPAAIQPVSNQLTDDLIDEELHSHSSDHDLPDDSLLTSLDDAAKVKNDATLEDELDLLFVDTDQDDKSNEADRDTTDFDDLDIDFSGENLDEKSSELELPGTNNTKDDDYLDFGDDLFDVSSDDSNLEDETVIPALDDVDVPERVQFTTDDLGDDQSTELEDKLDSFFGLEDSSSNEFEETIQDNDPAVESVTPALADASEEGGFREDVVSEELGDDPSAELEGKLDSFFGLEDEKPDIDVDVDISEDSTPPATTFDDTVVPALDDVDDEQAGFSEEVVVSSLQDDSTGDIQDQLDSFFGSDSDAVTPAAQTDSRELFEDDTTTPALFDADDAPNLNEGQTLEQEHDPSLSEIDDKLNSFFGSNDETKDIAPSSNSSSIAGITALFTASTAAVFSDQIKNFVTSEKNTISENQSIILTLLDTAAEILADRDEDAALNGVIADLGKEFDKADQPGVLMKAVTIYTDWQKDFFNNSNMAVAKTADKKKGTGADADVIEQVSAGFAQLRESMKEEFRAIKKELQP